MSGWIKICGLGSEQAVRTAVAAGADAVGFVFHAASPRDIAPALAARLCRDVPAAVMKVAVTHHPSQDAIDAIVAEFAPDALQTDAEDFDHLVLPPGLARLPVLRSGARAPAALPRRFLYEGPRSGSGATVDWEAARALAARSELVLAGGLAPGNVGRAIERVQPFGVDVSSGVESAPGVKDDGLIRDFVAAARAAWMH